MATAESLVLIPERLKLRIERGSAADRRSPAKWQGVLGVDGGGTKTAAAYLSSGGEMAQALSGPSNADVVGLDEAIANVLRAMREAASGAVGASGCLIGLAGLLSADQRARVGLEVARAFDLPVETVLVVNDTVNAWAAATAAQPGIVAILGTGSNVLGVGRAGEVWRSGGWGHLLGDEASGWWFGLQAIRWATAFRDGRMDAPPFLEQLLERLAFGRGVEELAQNAYSARKKDIADLAALLVREADHDHPIATDLVSQGIAAFVPQVVAVSARVSNSADPLPVVGAGGLFSSHEYIRGELGRQVAAALPSVVMRSSLLTPVVGALLLAARALSLDEREVLPLLLPRDAPLYERR